MRKEYREMQERLMPDQEKKEEIWGEILNTFEKRKKQKREKFMKTGVIGSVTAAVLVCMLMIPQIGLADRIKYILNSFPKNSKIAKEIQQDYFTDQDQHINIQIKELLSDGTNVYLGIRYKALDQEGADWLSKQEESNRWIKGEEQIFSYMTLEQERDYSIGFSENVEEQKKLATDQERHFVYTYFESGDSSGTVYKEQTFRYAMPTGYREIAIPRKQNVEKILYQMKQEEALECGYQPVALNVSKLSFQFLLYWNPDGNKTEEDKLNALDSTKVTFIMKDGSKRYGLNDSVYSPQKDSIFENQIKHLNQDYTVLSGQFSLQEYRGQECDFATIQDPEQVVAVEFSGKRYDLVRQK